MLDKSLSVEGDNNIVLNDVKDSTINLVQSESKIKALKQVYDLFHEANNGIRENIDKLFNRYITYEWRTIEAIQSMHSKVKAFHIAVENNKFYFNNTLYEVFAAFCEEAENTMDSIDLLTMTIASMKFDDMDEIYLYQYETVRDMMDSFYSKDKHPAFLDFADQYEKFDRTTKKVINLFEKERGRIV